MAHQSQRGGGTWARYMSNPVFRYGWQSAVNGGWDVSVHEFGQSWERKSAAAQAAAMILRKHGIDATSHNRID